MKVYKAGIIASLIFALYYHPAKVIIKDISSFRIPDFVDSHIEEIIKAQEKRLSLKHLKDPSIRYDLNCRCPYLYGRYDPLKDVVHLQTRNLVTPELNVVNLLDRILTFDSVANVETKLNHEMGHFYCDKLYESLGLGDYIALTFNQKLVSEGIAEYFERKNLDDRMDVSTFTPPTSLKGFKNWGRIYNTGYWLVKPIIDKYGREGIKYLLLHPPTNKDIFELADYRNVALMDLESQRKNAK